MSFALIDVNKMKSAGKFIGAYDYFFGIWLIASPWLFQFSFLLSPSLVSILIGSGIIVNSLFTNYRYGLIRFIPVSIHNLTDLATGLLLFGAPWLFRYDEFTKWPHVLTGLSYLLVTLRTRRKPVDNNYKQTLTH
jgi:hypothetical protein